MRRRSTLWIGFVLVHAFVALIALLLPSHTVYDVATVYRAWAEGAMTGSIPGVTTAFVYPPLALAPMIVNLVPSLVVGYVAAWAILVTGLNALAFAMLVGRATSVGRNTAAVFWLLFIVFAGPVGIYRIDAITVPFAIAGLLWLRRRPALGAALITLGAWIKVWPVALLAAALIVVRRRLRLVAGAAVISLAVASTVIGLGGSAHLLSFVSGQTGRGLQMEATVATIYLWLSVAGVEGARIYYDRQILTSQVAGPGADIVSAAMTPLLAVAVVAVMVIGAWRAWRGAAFSRVFPPLALALVLVLIVFNKVGSPQFVVWLIAPVVLWLCIDRHRARRPAAISLAVALLTQAVYPFAHSRIAQGEVWAVALITARNALMVVMLVWIVVRLVRTPSQSILVVHESA